ncbi:U1 small nuclear ribonucleoprotein C-like isoform X2 [Rhinatrema bivittatum]|uniref:U1 small nuclear ribonucleoprotein C-like isoform X2 n=1 Tax=Rhinatrema bivittatum TaxID=194408 RepID=UPI00112CF87C|nr:U1 small nuclear ribonucleoprotein C-like isoform X2 [Rhinatrema bivittatum]
MKLIFLTCLLTTALSMPVPLEESGSSSRNTQIIVPQMPQFPFFPQFPQAPQVPQGLPIPGGFPFSPFGGFPFLGK